MKSYGKLWEKIIDEENILAGWMAFRKNHKNAPGVPRFHRHIEDNLTYIRARLAKGTWEPGQYHQFRVLDPKPRLISCCPVRDRIVHHALCNVIAPLMDRRFIDQTYACRKGKGSHEACNVARELSRRHRYFLKIDVRKYFDNIDHGILLGIIGGMFREKPLRDLCEKIVCRFNFNFTPSVSLSAVNDECFSVRPSGTRGGQGDVFDNTGAGAVHSGRGLPIGNLTSQWFANLYLDAFDHFAVEQLHLGKRYMRYMDDILAFFDSKDEAWDAYYAMRDWLWEKRLLALKDEATLVAPATEGIPFLGLKIKPGGWRLKPSRFRRTQRTMRRHCNAYLAGDIGEERFQDILRSMEGAARYFGFKGVYARFDVVDRRGAEGDAETQRNQHRGAESQSPRRNNPGTGFGISAGNDEFSTQQKFQNGNSTIPQFHNSTISNREPEAGSSTVDRVIRGGSYNNDASNCSSAYRNVNNAAGNSNQNIGARLSSVFDATKGKNTRAKSKTPFRNSSDAAGASEHAVHTAGIVSESPCPRASCLVHRASRTIKPSNDQTIKRSNHQTIKPSNLSNRKTVKPNKGREP